jgi:hypothetical protein
MTKDEVIQWAVRHGFTSDKYGHMQKTRANGDRFRLKLQDKSWRYEKRISFGQLNIDEYKHPDEWMRLTSGYYSHTTMDGKDKIKG